ncbi:ATP synthase-coupling factor 6, mitochondrial [Lingula anatina]|uniref:ATP synthase-coupling factor 6, mitochondrial n=1 Tax=Lingula anatina TaxID=7574 RepID=A0A1S3IGW3_LINAN|nr:ATP synthase-coupling factor 6, mitochondrial-like [Lingula anatina]XP_013397388.1 ATP synthase-coupling factor 6, mitochondrial [Lingula anatina]|eukprot:XP_013397378.1 ATP synthase-coupling factor 6, mitochondrial-like [Lingula anatina]
MFRCAASSLTRNVARQNTVLAQCHRNIGITAVLGQKSVSDPIQQLFLEKVRAYDKELKATGKLPGLTKEDEAAFEDRLEKLRRHYNVVSEAEMLAFPTFKWQDPPLEAIKPEGIIDVQVPEDERLIPENFDPYSEPFYFQDDCWDFMKK